jgi:beta-galactosidase
VVRIKSLGLLCLCAIVVSFQGRAQAPQTAAAVRERLAMDSGWRFALGHAADQHKDFNYSTVTFFFGKAGYGDGPASPKFDDRAWRKVDLPHDWAVELPFDPRGDTNHGSKAIGRNFPENSVGWYRKTFTIPKEDLGRRIEIDFDGVYRDSVVWLNGFYLGGEHSGYSGFHFDMTNYVNYGGINVLVVRVNATVEEGWFYEGAGIYRHVWLTKTAPLHVAHDGVFVSSTVTGPAAAHPSAEVTTRVTVENDDGADAPFTLAEEIRDADGKVVASSPEVAGSAPTSGANELSIVLHVPDAKLWSLETPYLHKLITTVRSEGHVVDRYETVFGIRTVRFDPSQGFFLNDRRVEIKGTNDHQDHAGVGVAVPDSLNEFRVARLKEMGSNAIRTSHNPPTPELLDACDRMGMLVLDENRMMGTTPEDFAHLRGLIVRDRNHPSVILWSLGNEEWALEWSAFGERLTRDMRAFATRLDPTRRSTVALSGSGGGNSLSADVLGFNYYLQHHIDALHERFPDRPMVGTEESSSEHTRGVYADDPAHQHLVAYDFEADGKHASVEDSWRYYLARPFAAGLFYWTGFDYRGEPAPFDWPAIASQFGALDTCGFFKDNAYLLQSWWTEKPMVHLLPHWNWPGKQGQPIDVRVYSNADAVELLLNDKSLGRKTMPRNSHLEWKVAYEPGTLIARGYAADGGPVASDAVSTTLPASAVQLIPHAAAIAADGMSVSVVGVRVNDAQGRLVPDAANLVSFDLAGPGKIIGVGNGDPASHEADKYVESVSSIPVTGWRTHARDSKSAGPEDAAPGFDDSAWPKATDPRWDERRIDPPASVFRGGFDLPAGAERAAFKLLLRCVGDTQSVYVNGHALAQDLKADPAGYGYALDPSLLRAGRNVVALYVARFSEANKSIQAFRWDEFGPAEVQAVLPAPQWKRSVFNGLAQVIVQSQAEAGEIRLTASSPGLSPAVATIVSRPAPPVPMVK